MKFEFYYDSGWFIRVPETNQYFKLTGIDIDDPYNLMQYGDSPDRNAQKFEVTIKEPLPKIGQTLTDQQIRDFELHNWVFYSPKYGGLLQYDKMCGFYEFGDDRSEKYLPNYTFEVVWIPNVN